MSCNVLRNDLIEFNSDKIQNGGGRHLDKSRDLEHFGLYEQYFLKPVFVTNF